MKLLYFIFIAYLFFFVQAQDGDSFSIYFYEEPNFKNEAGFLTGSVKKGQGAGTPRGNMTVRSFKAPKWLQVTLFEKHYWGGDSSVFTGPQKNIKLPFTVHSVKWKHL